MYRKRMGCCSTEVSKIRWMSCRCQKLTTMPWRPIPYPNHYIDYATTILQDTSLKLHIIIFIIDGFMDMFTHENFKWGEDSTTCESLGGYISVIPLNAGDNTSITWKKKSFKLHVKFLFVSRAQISKLCSCMPYINMRGHSHSRSHKTHLRISEVICISMK